MQSGCYPDRPKPPSIIDLKNKGWAVNPWPVKSNYLSNIDPKIPLNVVREMDLNPGDFYFTEAVARPRKLLPR